MGAIWEMDRSVNKYRSFSDRLLKLLPGYSGIGKRSDRFASFLRSRGATEDVVSMFDGFALTGQIVLDMGIVFSENEILCRNEFVEGDFVVIGSSSGYLPLVIDVTSGAVGTLSIDDDGRCDYILGANNGRISFVDFLLLHAKDMQGVSSRCYRVPEMFNVDALEILRTLSDCGCGNVTHASAKFCRWLEGFGIEKSFCFFNEAPKTEISVGACTIESESDIMAANFEARRLNNPRFMFIGTCTDGCFIVLDKSTSPMSVGYVAFMEIGDKPGWENHYVRVSSSFGAFLHDSGILGILPDDYYQALSLGFRSQDCGVCGVASTECLQMVKQRAAERQLATGEYYRVFHNLQSLRLSDEPVANMLPDGSKDIWMFSSAGFGVLCRQVSCKVDESDFLRFAERCTNQCVRAVRECSIGYHSHTICRRFLDEREHENFSCAGACGDRIEGRRFLALDIPVCKGRLMCGYCYDRLTRTLGCWFGR